MSTETAFPGLALDRKGRLRGLARKLGTGLLAAVRAKAAPAAVHLRDHGYSIVGLGCISGASFVHSFFSGLLVTGILLLVFEWKVSE